MTLAFFIDSLAAGGAERQLILLANHFAARGYKTHLLVYLENFQLLDELDGENVTFHYIRKSGKFDPRFVVKLTRRFRQIRPNILISFMTGPNFWARLCGKLGGVRNIVTSERNVDIEQSRLRMQIERIMHRQSRKIVTNSQSCRALLHRGCAISLDKIVVIYNGIDTNFYRPSDSGEKQSLRKKFGLNANDFVISLPGRMQLQKNHQCLIRAAARLAPDFDNLKILFVGNENDLAFKNYLLRTIIELGLQSMFRFCGLIRNMPELYNAVDTIVLPSKWEGLPNVLLEAMSCQQIVIASDIADNSRIIENNENGFLFESDNDSELADVIRHVVQLAPIARVDIGRKARIKVKENFSVSAYIDNYENLIRSLSINVPR